MGVEKSQLSTSSWVTYFGKLGCIFGIRRTKKYVTINLDTLCGWLFRSQEIVIHLWSIFFGLSFFKKWSVFRKCQDQCLVVSSCDLSICESSIDFLVLGLNWLTWVWGILALFWGKQLPVVGTFMYFLSSVSLAYFCFCVNWCLDRFRCNLSIW